MEKPVTNSVQVKDFGKDHWSLLAYIETCCVDQKGKFDLRRIRVNPVAHPLCAVGMFGPRKWKSEYGTRLQDGNILPDHDDINCLDDLEAAGLVEVISLVNSAAILTKCGKKVALKLRKHKIDGGMYGNFSLKKGAEA